MKIQDIAGLRQTTIDVFQAILMSINKLLPNIWKELKCQCKTFKATKR